MEPQRTHLFVVEDDPPVREMLGQYLEQQGMQATLLASAEELLKRMHRTRPDLVILDVSLPGVSGLEACQKLRSQGDRIPIILLTARTEEVDRILGLEMGADDYLGKPFSARELLARIRAVLRRVSDAPKKLGTEDKIKVGHSEFDPQGRCLVLQDGSVRVLSTVEYAMLAELVANPNVPISRERLLHASHSRAEQLASRSVDVSIMRLRRLIEPDPNIQRHIQTVRSHGYMFVP